MKTFEGGPKAINSVVYRFASLPTIFLSCRHCSPLCLSFHLLFLISSSFIRYIFHKLLPKGALNSAFFPAFFEEGMDDSSNNFIYTSHQVIKYPSSHLMVTGWYLDCSGGFVPTLEEALHQSLTQTTPVEMVDLEEPDESQEQPSL